MARKAVEQTGLIPRSIIRTLDRFRKQLFPEAEQLIIQEFRISRSQFIVSIKCLASLIFIPLIVNYFLKNFILMPLTEKFWNTQQPEIFLNSYQQDRAFNELKKFQDKLYFDYLLNDLEISDTKQINLNKQYCENLNIDIEDKSTNFNLQNLPKEKWLNNKSFEKNEKNVFCNLVLNQVSMTNKLNTDTLPLNEIIQTKIQHKTLELAIHYNYQSILAITNLLGDFVTFLVISLLLIYMKAEITILKSFLTESIYSLNDTKKSFLLILGTDLLVGFHSPRGWEICLELLLRHFGFPENKDFVFLFVASFPVLLDTVFKYWIFRYLNKISPSTVATYHSMIE